jgi:hypothetical protein
MECNFQNNQEKFSSVQVPLYIRSRIDDIINKQKKLMEALKHTQVVIQWIYTVFSVRNL